jgi:hypothetical protein
MAVVLAMEIKGFSLFVILDHNGERVEQLLLLVVIHTTHLQLLEHSLVKYRFI